MITHYLLIGCRLKMNNGEMILIATVCYIGFQFLCLAFIGGLKAAEGDCGGGGDDVGGRDEGGRGDVEMGDGGVSVGGN